MTGNCPQTMKKKPDDDNINDILVFVDENIVILIFLYFKFVSWDRFEWNAD